MKPKMNLLENLQQQTASFKEMYIQKTEDWAKEQAKRNITRWNFFQKNAGNKKAFSSLQSYYDEEKWFYRVKPYELDEKMYVKKLNNILKIVFVNCVLVFLKRICVSKLL